MDDKIATINIKYLPGAHELTMSDKGDWIDLYCYEDTYLKEGEFKKVSLGVAMALPDGYEAYVLPRSSTYGKWHVVQTNSMGLIDNSYKGNDDIWMIPIKADKEVFIPKDKRICQFRIQKKQPQILFNQVSYLGSNRGGFGSTGE